MDPLWPYFEARDFTPANRGAVEMYRDVQINGHAERHIGLHVVGSCNPALSLGLVAIRCERKGETLIPLTLSIPETPPAAEPVPVATPMQWHSQSRRARRWLY